MLLRILKLVKLQHALFALPLTLGSFLLASKGSFDLRTCGLIVLAFFCARSLGMALNRLIDRHIDAKNPRTAHRLMASQKMTPAMLWPWLIVFTLLFLFSASQLNLLALQLAPLCIFLLWLYPYCKRFTWGVHFVLGLILAMGPMGAWIGVQGQIEPALIWFCLGVITWVSGFDILYAIADLEFDRQEGLYSIPACFSKETALTLSFLLHMLSIAFWVIFSQALSLTSFLQPGMVLLSLILFSGHLAVRRGYRKHIALAFFWLNILISHLILILLCLEIYV